MLGAPVFRTALFGPWSGNALWTAARAVPSLDLCFADKKDLICASSGRQLISFARASSGTYVDSAGVLSTAVTNLKPFSDAILTANAYSATNATLATVTVATPTTSSTATLLTLNVGANTGNNTDGFNYGSAITLTNSTQHAQSLFVKPAGATVLRLRSNVGGTLFDFTLTGNGTAPSPSLDLQAASIVAFANGWYRVSWTFTATTSAPGNRGDYWTIKTNVADGTNGLYVVGAQLEQSSTVGEYVPTGSTINSAPRFDHDPLTGESLGLLVEEQRTNLVLRSEEFEATWTPTALQAFGSGSVANAIASPSSSITADLITENTANSEHSVLQAIAVTVNTVYTLSCFAKKGTRSILAMSPTSPGVANYYTLFNLDTGAIVFNETGNTSTITALGNGWYRCSITRTTGAAQVTSNNKIGIANNTLSTTYTGDGTSGIYIWGAQLEANPSATEYQYIGSTWTRSPYGVPDPSAEFPREIFYVDRKVVETRDVVEFELAAAFDLAGVRAPKRQCISNICQWVYRSAECGYTAPLYFDENDALETTAAADVCGKRLSSCQVRFSSYTRTGSVTSGSTTITLTPPTSLSAGTPIAGHGIPAGTVTVGTVLDGTTFTLSQAANANTTVTKMGAVQSNRTSMVVSNVVGLTLGMAVSGPYIPAGTTITGVAGNTVSLSQPASINFQVAFTRPNINIYPVAGQTAYSHLYVINTAGISVGMAVTGPGLPSDLSARVTGLTTISFLGVAIISYAVARSANGTYTFYSSTAYASTSYIFTGSTTYAIRGASDSLPFGSFPGVGAYYA